MSSVVTLCGANSKQTKAPCRARALKGSVPPRCRHHIGSTKAKARAAVRAELEAWRLVDEVEDPNVVLLRLMTQAYRRAAYYGWILEQLQDDAGHELEDLTITLIGTVKKAAGAQGMVFDSEEAIRGMVVLEAQERDRAARFAKLAIDAGIADRIVRLEESKAAEVVGLIRRVLIAAGVDPTGEVVSRAVHRELLALDAGSNA